MKIFVTLAISCVGIEAAVRIEQNCQIEVRIDAGDTRKADPVVRKFHVVTHEEILVRVARMGQRGDSGRASGDGLEPQIRRVREVEAIAVVLNPASLAPAFCQNGQKRERDPS